MAKCLCSVSKPWFFILLLFLYSVQKRIDMQKNESERAGKAFCYCFSFLNILNLHVYINLNFTRLRFEFDITWLNVCVLKTLNFWLLIFLLFSLEKRINVPKNPKTMRTSVLAKPSILVLIFSAFQIYLLIWTLYARVLNLILNG